MGEMIEPISCKKLKKLTHRQKYSPWVMKAKCCNVMQKCKFQLDFISKPMGRCDPKLRGAGNTCRVCALTHMQSMRMIMHEFMKHELCMCIEMHTCEIMHVGEWDMPCVRKLIWPWECLGFD